MTTEGLQKALQPSQLGKPSEIPNRPSAEILFVIERAVSRQNLDADPAALKMQGNDLWNCYELSWLTKAKIPQAAIVRVAYKAQSRYIIESKSLKLYLASHYNSAYADPGELCKVIRDDITDRMEDREVKVEIFTEDRWKDFMPESLIPQGFCLETLDRAESDLRPSDEVGEESVYTTAFRSLCPVTAQPDWATIHLHYFGRKIQRESLLGYFSTFRDKAGFHEEVCERIYCDIYKLAEPKFLAVRANFMRRGGIDLNPIRYSQGYDYPLTYRRVIRQ